MTAQGMTNAPADDRLPVQVTDTVTRGTFTPTYPVIACPNAPADGGDAIARGVVYRRNAIPALTNTLLFADITTGRLWYAHLRDVVFETFKARGGPGDTLPGAAAISGRGRVDVRLAQDSSGEVYLLTKSGGVIRRVTGMTHATPQR